MGGYFALQNAFYALMFYLGNAYFRPELWVWSTTTVRALNLSLISGGYVCLMTFLSKQRRTIDNTFFFVFLCLVHTLCSTLLSEDFAYSWFYWKDFLKTIIIMYVMVLLVDDQSKFRAVLMMMVFAMVFEIKQGLVHIVFNPGEKNFNVHPVLGDDNGVALGMLMLVPICAVLAQTTAHKWMRWFYRILLVGAFYRSISSYSRGAFIACLAMGFVYWLRTPHKARMIFGALVLIALVAPLMPEKFWDRMHTIETYKEDQESSALSRLHFWAVARSMAASHPFFGVGYMGYTRSYDNYDFLRGLYGKRRAVHSSWFGVLAELGYVGFTLYGAVLFVSLRNCYIVHKLTTQFAHVATFRLYEVALEASLVVWLVGGSFHIYQYNEFAWHYLALTFILKRITEDACYEVTPKPYAPSLAYA